jgi:hypothetical protein
MPRELPPTLPCPYTTHVGFLSTISTRGTHPPKPSDRCHHCRRRGTKKTGACWRMGSKTRRSGEARGCRPTMVLHCHLHRPFRDHGTRTRHRQALAHHRLLGPQQTAWSVQNPSEDGVLEGRPTARERLGYAPRNRNRSLSAGGGKNERVTSPAPLSTKWLGLRTAKAFAGAGLRSRK